MTYLFLGQEQFLKNQTLCRLKLEACGTAVSNMNYEEFQSGEDGFNELIDNAKTAPFMGKYRLFVLKDVNKLNSQEKGLLVSFMQEKPKSTVLALTAAELPAEDILRKAASERGKIMNFDLLQGAQLNKWIVDRFARFNKRIEPQALRLLTDNVGNNLMRLELAVELLATFVGNIDYVKQDDVEKLIGKSMEMSTYQLVDAIGSKNADLALRILEGFDRDSRTISQAIGLIGWHLRRIWRAKKAGQISGVPHYAKNGFIRQIDNFSTKELEKAFRALLKLDKDIKTSSTEAYRALEMLIMQLCG